MCSISPSSGREYAVFRAMIDGVDPKRSFTSSRRRTPELGPIRLTQHNQRTLRPIRTAQIDCSPLTPILLGYTGGIALTPLEP
jgi:hypothetical protein